MRSTVLILPGYANSDKNHWQSLWQSKHPNFKRVEQKSWSNPVCDDWVITLEKAISDERNVNDEKDMSENTAISTEKAELKIVAHSLGCLLLAKWAEQTQQKISGALLVAVPNPKEDNFPKDVIGFDSIAKTRFDFPSTVIASNNDPYASLSFAQNCTEHWGSQFIALGDFGHINSESGLDDWPFGFDQLMRL